MFWAARKPFDSRDNSLNFTYATPLMATTDTFKHRSRCLRNIYESLVYYVRSQVDNLYLKINWNIPCNFPLWALNVWACCEAWRVDVSNTWRHVVCIHTVSVFMTNKPGTTNARFATILGPVGCATGWQQNIACAVVRRVTPTVCLRGSICSALIFAVGTVHVKVQKN
jgi:hypothetical protein